MINWIWGAMIFFGIGFAALNGRIEMVTAAAIRAAESAVTLSLHLVGIMCLWLGIMKLAEKAGLISVIARCVQPLLKVLFPGIPRGHKAMGAVVMTVSANMLGLGNAATPLGIKAMQELQTLNQRKDTATDAMCTFLALCTTGFTIVPATVIALRSAAGSLEPTSIVGVTIVVSLTATGLVLAADCIWRKLRLLKGRLPYGQ